MKKGTVRFAVFLVLTAVWIAGAAPKPRRLDLYDISGNMLMRVAFDYDASQNNVTQTLYDPNWFLLRRSTVSAGRQDYSNDAGDLTNYVIREQAGEKTTTSIFDEFDKMLYQDSYSTTAANGTYTFDKSGSVTYQYQDAEISRIDIKDNLGRDTHYALVDYTGVNTSPRARTKTLSRINTIRPLDKGKVYIEFVLVSSQKVTAQLYDLKGELKNNIMDKSFPKGFHGITLDMESNGTNSGNGIYILKFSLGSRQNTFKMKVVK